MSDKIVKFLTIVISRSCTLDNSSPPASRRAVLPKKVLTPVCSTVPSVSPRTTVEPIKVLSPSYSWVCQFMTSKIFFKNTTPAGSVYQNLPLIFDPGSAHLQ